MPTWYEVDAKRKNILHIANGCTILTWGHLDVKNYKQGALKRNFLEEIKLKIIFTKTPLFEGIHQNNLFNVSPFEPTNFGAFQEKMGGFGELNPK